jgi:TolB-like protein/Tfp pilus assembly protein PilF
MPYIILQVMASAVSSPPEGEVRETLDRICASSAFARSRRQQRFLRYLVEAVLAGRAEELKETVLGIEVFDRGPDFDPRVDNIVRVEARRLRQRLQTYGECEGAASRVVIELPTGSYVPQLTLRAASGLAPAAPGRSAPVRRSFRNWWIVAAVVTGALGTASWYWWQRPEVLAVLPFTDLSPDGAARYQADAVTEDLTQGLAQAPGVRVVARTSALRYRDSHLDARQIGRELGARLLLEGSVQPSVGRIRIRARLVDTRTGLQTWSAERDVERERFEPAELEIAAAAARALHSGLPTGLSSYSASPEVQDLVLRARFRARSGGEANLRDAETLYERALLLDPRHAKAWGEYARVLSLSAFLDSTRAPALAPRVREASAQAVQLGDRTPAPLVGRARMAWAYEWNWAEAERNWRLALKADPNLASTHLSYALGLAARGRSREAVAEARAAVDLDPLAYAASNDLGVVLYSARRYGEAEAQARRSLALTPASGSPLYMLGTVYAGQGRFGEAAAELERAVARLSRGSLLLARLGAAKARSGHRDEALALLDEIRRDAGAPAMAQAILLAALGERPAALDALARSAAARETDFLFALVDAALDPLRAEPRFTVLCQPLLD